MTQEQIDKYESLKIVKYLGDIVKMKYKSYNEPFPFMNHVLDTRREDLADAIAAYLRASDDNILLEKVSDLCVESIKDIDKQIEEI